MAKAGEFISASEAAKLLGVSVRRIQQLVNEKILPATRLGRRALLIRRDDLPLAKKRKRKPGPAESVKS